MNNLLTVNGGSSSLKCALYQASGDTLKCSYQLKVSTILGAATFSVRNSAGLQVIDKEPLQFERIAETKRHEAALQQVLGWLDKNLPEVSLDGIGHRVVHGGDQYSGPVEIDEALIRQLEQYVPLAPLHQPYNLRLVQACHAMLPDVRQIACFDTMFHRQQPAIERNYALPRELTESGIHRYGFHGLSYEYIQRQLDSLNCGQFKTIIFHLGSGASMCAVDKGRSIASSMGFTAVDGLPMGSRCGSIDPGLILYLLREEKMDLDTVEQLIYKKSGWLGISGISSDMQELHKANHPKAEEAIDQFCYRAALEAGRLAAALQGVEQLVFTGGVGENDADVRQRIAERCRWLGVTINPERNRQGKGLINDIDSTVMVRVIPTDEEAMIARHILEVFTEQENGSDITH
ncbi:acetate/propionate family kinase [Marinobacterium jannaschii]|uniref:acetate/propionate family kinase n=1 Tax=Marinobacterium jannaschii TaxID=64970 RepID=UPI0006856914|nr:acetate/propionate family kinase [Marinobacterium jannaschii]